MIKFILVLGLLFQQTEASSAHCGRCRNIHRQLQTTQIHSHAAYHQLTKSNLNEARAKITTACTNEPVRAVLACEQLGHNYMRQLLQHKDKQDPCRTELLLCGPVKDPPAFLPLPGSLSAVGMGVDVRGKGRPYNVLQQQFPTTNPIIDQTISGKNNPIQFYATNGTKLYYYPDTMSCQNLEAASLTTTTSSHSNSQSFVNDIFVNVNLDIDTKAFGLDLGVQVTNDKSGMDKSAHTLSYSTANVQTVHCGMTEYPGRLHPNFTTAVLQLPVPVDKLTREEQDEYLEFLNQWGTHYVEGALLGGTATSRSEITSAYTFSKSDKEVKVDADIYFRAIKLKLDVDIHHETTKSMSSYTDMENYHMLGGDANAFAQWVEAPSQANASQARIQKLATWMETVETNPNQVPAQTQLRNISDLISKENFPGYPPEKIKLVQEWLMFVLGIDLPYEIPVLWACKFQGQVQHEDKDGYRYHNFTGGECSRGELPLATIGTPDPQALINQQCVYGFATRADHCGFGSNLLWEVNGTQVKYRYQGYECNDQTEFEVHYLCVESFPPIDLHHCHNKQFYLDTSGFQSVKFSPGDCTNNGPTGICYSTMPRMAYDSSDVVPTPTIASENKVCPTGINSFMLTVQNSTGDPNRPTAVCLSVIYTAKLPGTNTNVIKQLQKCDASDPNQLFVLENATNPTAGGKVHVKHLTSGKCLSVTVDKPNRVGVVDCTDTATNTKWIVNASKPGTLDQTVTLGIKNVFDGSTLAMAYCPGNDTVCGTEGICVAVDSIPPTAPCKTSSDPLHNHYHTLEFKPVCGGVTNWGLWGLTARPPPPYNLTIAGGLPVPPLMRNSADNIPELTFRGPATQATVEVGAHYFCTNLMVGNKSFPKLHQCTVASKDTTDMVGSAGKVVGRERRWRKVTLADEHCTNGVPQLVHGGRDSYISYSLRRTEELGMMPMNFVIQGNDIKWEDNFYQEDTVISIDYLVYDPAPH